MEIKDSDDTLTGYRPTATGYAGAEGSGTVESCFYLCNTVTEAAISASKGALGTSGGSEPLTSDQFKDPDTFIVIGWSMTPVVVNGLSNVDHTKTWFIRSGSPFDRPMLSRFVDSGAGSSAYSYHGESGMGLSFNLNPQSSYSLG